MEENIIKVVHCKTKDIFNQKFAEINVSPETKDKNPYYYYVIIVQDTGEVYTHGKIINSNTLNKLKTLIGNDSDKSVRKIAEEEISKVIDNAPEMYDTLQEIAAWIEEHGDEVAEINNGITTNTQNISTIFEHIAWNASNIIPNYKYYITKSEFIAEYPDCQNENSSVYNDIVYIHDVKEIYTHGRFYNEYATFDYTEFEADGDVYVGTYVRQTRAIASIINNYGIIPVQIKNGESFLGIGAATIYVDTNKNILCETSWLDNWTDSENPKYVKFKAECNEDNEVTYKLIQKDYVFANHKTSHLITQELTVNDQKLQLDSSTDTYVKGNGTLGKVNEFLSSDALYNEESFLYRRSNVEKDDIVTIQSIKGNSIVWNQLVSSTTTSITLTNGRKYISRINGIDNYHIPADDSSTLTVTGGLDNLFDLTKMFGAGNEPDTIEEFRALYPDSYYPYNASELRNLDCSGIETIGFNQWDEQWEVGAFNHDNGQPIISNEAIRCVNYIPLISGETYFFRSPISTNLHYHFYDINKNFVSWENKAPGLFTVPDGVAYLRFNMSSAYGTTYKNDICINFFDPLQNGQYIPHKNTYRKLPLNEITNGEPLRKAGVIYDEINETEYIRRVGTVDLGNASWEKIVAGGFMANINSAKIGFYATTSFNMVHNAYFSWRNIDSFEDNCLYINKSNNAVYGKFTMYATADDVKAALSGVILNYELAEPEIYTIDKIVNFHYAVYKNGTEKAITNQVPFVADMSYQFNIKQIVKRTADNVDILSNALSEQKLEADEGTGITILDNKKISVKTDSSLVFDEYGRIKLNTNRDYAINGNFSSNAILSLEGDSVKYRSKTIRVPYIQGNEFVEVPTTQSDFCAKLIKYLFSTYSVTNEYITFEGGCSITNEINDGGVGWYSITMIGQEVVGVLDIPVFCSGQLRIATVDATRTMSFGVFNGQYYFGSEDSGLIVNSYNIANAAITPEKLSRKYLGINDIAKFANDLTGRNEATSEEFTLRPSAGNKSIRDDSATIKKIKGNSVAFNQLIDYSKEWFRNSGIPGLIENSTFTQVGADFDFNVTTDSSTNYRIWLQNPSPQTWIGGHKYLILPNLYGNINETSNPLKYYARTFSAIAPYSNGQYGGVIVEATSNDTHPFALIQTATTIIPSGTYLKGHVNIFDLTQMFGAGNEPTTVEEFRALYPNKYYEYNSGELQDLNVSGIDTVGFNQWDEQWVVGAFNHTTGQPIINNDTIRCVNYIPLISGETYFFKSPISTYLHYHFYDINKNFVSWENKAPGLFTVPDGVAYLRFNMPGAYGATYKNDICINLSHTGYRDGEYEPYKKVTHNLPISTITGGEPLRKAGSVYDEINETEYIKRVGVRPYAEGDENDATLLTDGTNTNYPLAEPIMTPITEILDLNYYVEDFGTEKALLVENSAPFSADIVYQFNAIDTIRQNDKNLEILTNKFVSLENAIDQKIADAITITLNTKV